MGSVLLSHEYEILLDDHNLCLPYINVHDSPHRSLHERGGLISLDKGRTYQSACSHFAFLHSGRLRPILVRLTLQKTISSTSINFVSPPLLTTLYTTLDTVTVQRLWHNTWNTFPRAIAVINRCCRQSTCSTFSQNGHHEENASKNVANR